MEDTQPNLPQQAVMAMVMVSQIMEAVEMVMRTNKARIRQVAVAVILQTTILEAQANQVHLDQAAVAAAAAAVAVVVVIHIAQNITVHTMARLHLICTHMVNVKHIIDVLLSIAISSISKC